jgi:O-methyltransferase
VILLKRWKSVISTLRNATYAEDGLVACRISDFLFSGVFSHAYEAGKATGSWGDMDLRWRVYVCCWAGQHAIGLPGDFVECGVNRGGLASAVMKYTNFSESDKKFYLLDTYCGIPADLKKSSAKVDFNYPDCYEDVCKTFSQIPNAQIIRGAVPSTLPEVKSNQIAYLSLDMNSSGPEVAAALFFWDRIVSGGVIVLDDYCYSELFRDQKLAFDNLARRVNTQVLALPTGQGVVFKT